MKETFTTVANWHVGRLLGAVVLVTLAFELVGFLALYAATGDAWFSVFHSISAFCNAGFSLSSGSLRGQGAGVIVPILFLFVMGGLGFTTLLELGRNIRPRKDGRRRFSVHARLVFLTSIVLWGGGTIILTICEGGDIETAFFMSASARTAGFDTIDVGAMSGASLFVLIPLMFIGASPGSTGGGVKTTTLALAVLVARATLQGQERLVAYGRELPYRLVRRMFAVMFFSAVIVFLTIFLLHLFEGGRSDNVLHYAFEATSAFGTVGLSTGLTASLTVASKLLLCAVMFLGRVGSLSIFILLVRPASPSRVRYPEESVLIG